LPRGRSQSFHGAALGFDHKRLAQQRRHAVADTARRDVGGGAGRERHDDLDRAARVGVGMAADGAGRRNDERGGWHAYQADNPIVHALPRK
jgi:hypothetical protein